MGLLEKLKLLLKERKPVTDIITELKDVKTGWKTWQFWITLLGSISVAFAAADGLIPASVILIVTTAVALVIGVYNLWRGATKTQVQGQKPFFQTSEFWVSLAGLAATAITTLQSGGINPAAFKTALAAITVILGSLGAGQNLAGQQPGVVPAPAVPAK